MSIYSYDINTDLYKYNRPVIITEPTGERQTYVPLKLNLNSANFNFDLPRSDGLDFRLAEKSNGTGVLKMWIAYWSYSDEKATLWFNLPELLPSEIKIMYAIWGYEYDTGISDLESMTTGVTKEYSSNLCVSGTVTGHADGIVDGNSGYPSYAFDGIVSPSNHWRLAYPGTGWIQYDFGAGNEKQIEYIRFYQYDAQNYVIQGSNNGTAFTTLKSGQFIDMSGGSDVMRWVLVAFDNSTSYRYIRITILSDWDDVVFLGEIEMMEVVSETVNEDGIFSFADDFDGSSLNVSNWPTSAGSFTISNSKINLGTNAYIRTLTGAISTDWPVNWIVEEGIIGIGSPTTTTVYAHRYSFYGSENNLRIYYYWEGNTDRRHDFVYDDTLSTYNGTNKGLLPGIYAQNYIAYYEPTDRVYQGMLNRGGDQVPIYSEDLCVDDSSTSAFAYVNDGYKPAMAIDGSTSTMWLDATNTGSTWWGYTFDTALFIVRVTLHFYYAKKYYIQGSNSSLTNWDNKTWTDLYESPQGDYTDSQFDHVFDNAVSYKYIRILILDSDDPGIKEIEMMILETLSGEFDYDDSWERKVDRNTEVTNFRIYGENGSTANGVSIDWVIVRPYTPDSDPLVNYAGLWVDHEYLGHQIIDYTEYTADITDVDFHHISDMGGDPYRMSDDVTNSISNIFISDTGITEGSITIDFGRNRYSVTDNNYTHFDSTRVDYYNASKLSDLDNDVYDRDYWETTTTSGWAAIQFPSAKDISCLALKAVPGQTSRMANNFRFYGSQTDPRFDGWNERVLIFEAQARDSEIQQVFYFSTGLTLYEYYILEVLDTHGGNIAIQEWGMYERSGTFGKRVISQLRLHPVAFQDNEYYFTKQVELYGSNNGFDWDLLLPNTDTPTPFTDYVYGRWSRYSFENFEAYYMYKLTCYDNWRADENIIKMAEWELVEKADEVYSHRILAGTSDNINNIWADPDTTISSGIVYVTNEEFNSILNEKLLHHSVLPLDTDDFNVKT